MVEAPSLSLPRFAGEGTAGAARDLSEGPSLLPLPRSGGGLGWGLLDENPLRTKRDRLLRR